MITLQHLYTVTDENTVIPVIAYEEGDDIIHTVEHPFCNEEGCLCGENAQEDDEEVPA